MAIDVNGIFGHWPVRTPGIHEPSEYLRTMDRFGVEQALVASTAALLDNTTLGNRRIAALVRSFPDRFLGACVVNPNPSPERAVSEIQRCLDEGFRAVRLYPGLHGYPATDSEVVDPVMEEAGRTGTPVLLTLRVTAHTGCPETPAGSARALAARHPDVPIIVSGASHSERLLLTRAGRACPNLLFEISLMQGAEAVRSLCEALGASRVLLGTGMGVLYASPAVRRARTAVISEDDRQAVLSGNARRLLAL